MKRRKDPLHQARVAAVHLSPEEFARASRRKDDFADLTRALIEFVHADPLLRDELEPARAHFFADYESLPDRGSGHAATLAHGRFHEWFIYERPSRSRRETPLESFIGALPPGDRRAFAESVRANVLDTFAVRAAAPELGLTLESLANGRVFDVVERSASQALQPGAVLIGRVFPLGDRLWTLSGVIFAIPDVDAAGVYAKQLARTKPEARSLASQRDLESVLASQHGRRRVGLSRPPGEFRPEDVDAMVTGLLAEAGIDADVAALRRRMADAPSPIPIIEGLMGSGRFTNEEHLQQTMMALMALWNTTPRPELGARSPDAMHAGRSTGPEELRLMSELIDVLEREGFPTRYKTAKRRQAAIAARQREWLGTPREDLGGRTPAEVIAAERNAPGRTPESATLPPATLELMAAPDPEANARRRGRRPGAVMDWAAPDVTQLRRLPVTPGVWLGGRFATRFVVREPQRHCPEVTLWLELPMGVIVSAEILEPGDPAGGLSRTLVAAMQAPMEGGPRRPRRVRVADAEQARELEVLQGLVAVDLGATPELDEVLEAMEAGIGAGPRTSYLEEGRVSPDAVAGLFRAARAIHALAPWKEASDAQVLRVDIARLGVAGACLVIIGADGGSPGLVLFPSLDGYQAMCAAEPARDGAARDIGTTYLALDFESADDVPRALRAETAQYGWELPAPGVYPVVRRCERDTRPGHVEERDVRVMAACATSLAAMLLRHPALFRNDDELPICETYSGDDGVAVRFTAPYDAAPLFAVNDAQAPRTAKTGRNDPCPCGSGRKYKHCHLGRPV